MHGSCSVVQDYRSFQVQPLMRIQGRLIYPFYLGRDMLFSKDFLQLCCSFGKRFMIITDDHMRPSYGHRLLHYFSDAGVCVDLLSIQPGEASKTRESKVLLEDQMLQRGCGRDTVVIALGGGVVLDLAGFVAATYMRGVPAIYVPTTLLAMVDSCIGGKTAINTSQAKNVIGTFSDPKAVWADIDILKSLPKAHYRTAYAEIIKHAVIADRAFLAF